VSRGPTKATVCRSCGAPRDSSIRHALCRPCFLLYKSTGMVRINERHNGGERARALNDTYARLGLSVGNVWKLVRS
jgi:hypothetical protein